MIIRDFQASDFERLAVQHRQAELLSLVPSALAEELERYESFTALDGERVLGCGGVVPVWQGRAQAWAYLGRDLGPFMVPITRAVKRFLAEQSVRRIEATASWHDGCRWLEMLGFKRETAVPMEGYLPGGQSAHLYARVL
jgi:hypothetical protein